MPSLNISAKHVERVDTRYVIDRPLTGQTESMVSTTCFPPDPSEFLSDKVWQIDYAAKLRRQPGFAGADGNLPTVYMRTSGTVSWNIPVYAWLCRVGNIEAATSDAALNVRRNVLATAHDKARIEREIRACLKLRGLANGQALGAGSRWDDISSTGSDPIANLQMGCEFIKRQTGLKPDRCYIPEPVMRKLTQHERLMGYLVNKLNLSKDRPIDEEILEALVGKHYLKPGSIRVYDFTFNDTPDSPYASAQFNPKYPLGNRVVLTASATPGGVDGADFGFGLAKYLEFLTGALKDEAQVTGGNEGIGVFEFPDYDVAGGGTKQQLVDAVEFWVQNALAAWEITGVADSTNAAEYQQSLTF